MLCQDILGLHRTHQSIKEALRACLIFKKPLIIAELTCCLPIQEIRCPGCTDSSPHGKLILLWGKASSKHSHVVETLNLVSSQGKNVEKQAVTHIAGRNVNWLKGFGGKFGNNLKIRQKPQPQQFKTQNLFNRNDIEVSTIQFPEYDLLIIPRKERNSLKRRMVK